MTRTVRSPLALIAIVAALTGCLPTADAPAPASSVVIVRSVGDAVVLIPSEVSAGTVRFVVEAPPGADPDGAFAFVSRSTGSDCPPCDEPPPLLADDIERLRSDSAPQGLGLDSGWGLGVTLTLMPGWYAFMVPGPDGGMPGSPPASITVLTVTD